jgi:hypothetical protein
MHFIRKKKRGIEPLNFKMITKSLISGPLFQKVNIFLMDFISHQMMLYITYVGK